MLLNINARLKQHDVGCCEGLLIELIRYFLVLLIYLWEKVLYSTALYACYCNLLYNNLQFAVCNLSKTMKELNCFYEFSI